MTNDTIASRRLPTRRAVVAASAWTAPAILLTVASPAHAVSTDLGLITFVGDQIDVVGAGAVHTYAVQLTVPTGRTVPAYVSVAYSRSGIVDGPLTVPTGGQTLFSFEVTALSTDGSTDIEISTPGFLPAKTSLAVIVDHSRVRFLNGSSYGTAHKDTVTDRGYGTPVNPAGQSADHFTNGKWGDPSTDYRNQLLLSGLLHVDGDLPAGPIDYRVRVLLGGEGLSWQTQSGSVPPNSGRPVTQGTVINGTAPSLGTITTDPQYFNTFPKGGNALIPIVRDRAVISNQTVYFELTFPRFPLYAVLIAVAY